MTRDKNIKIIQTRIFDEKRFELMKFSNKTSNKKNWNDVDYMTSFMHDVRHQNTMKFDDLFFESIFDDVEKNRRIWSLIQYVIKNTTAFRINKNVNKKNKKKQKFTIQDCWCVKKSNDFLSNFERSLISFSIKIVSAFKFIFKLFKFNVKNFKVKIKISKKKIKIDDRHQILKRHDVTIIFENKSILNLKIFFDLTNEDIADFNVKNEKISNIENVKFINAKKMTRKSYFVIFNIKNRWWKIWLIDQIMTHMNDRVTYLQKIKFVNDSTQMTKIDAKNWFVENARRINQNIIHYEIFDDETKINFDIWKKYFDNVSYQRNNLKKFCVNINIQ